MNENESAPLQMSQQFADLVFLALDHGINSVREGGPLVPFLVLEGDAGRELRRYCTDRIEESVRQARLAAASLPATVSMCALTYDGFVTVQKTKYDAIIVEAVERGKQSGPKLAQRYVPNVPKKLCRKFQTIGNPLSLGDCDSILEPKKTDSMPP